MNNSFTYLRTGRRWLFLLLCSILLGGMSTELAAQASFTYYADADGDTFGDASNFIVSVSPTPPPGYVSNSSDCNDSNPAIYPGAAETCNNLDDDCDGSTDEGLPITHYFLDADGDTWGSAFGSIFSCLPTAPPGYIHRNNDCDDSNAAINPQATEVCNNVDDDCDNVIDEGVKITFYADSDGDTYGNNAVSVLACTAPSGYVLNNNDCDDSNASIHPGAAEICNNIDDDCDNFPDNGITYYFYYADGDADTYGNAAVSQLACAQPPGYVLNSGDCNDNNSSIYPGAPETCNSLDDDCDGLTDDGLLFLTYYTDGDGDGYGTGSGTSLCASPGAGYALVSGDCDDGNAAINPSAQEICNGGVDDDCDGLADDLDGSVTGQGTWYADTDADTYGAGPAILACLQPLSTSANNSDCNDANAAIYPGAPETCNGMDDDCNGLTDDGLSFILYYTDADGDGYGTGSGTSLCSNPGAGYSTVNGDCDDTNGAVNPSALEVCDGGIDNNCNLLADDNDPGVTGQLAWYSDTDTDGYGTGVALMACIAPPFTSANDDDCNDNNSNIYPGATEICNGLDDDCNSLTDDGLSFSTWYADTDGDGYGNPSSSVFTCSGAPSGYVADNTDCNDNNIFINPAADEICNGGVDDDCDGLADDLDGSVTGQGTWYADTDGDGYGAGPAILACIQPGNSSLSNTDCNDSNAGIYPGATEICNGLDDDCNGLSDDGLVFSNYFSDNDGDGYGAGFLGNFCASPGAGSTTSAGDCNDGNNAVYPGATEVCNNVDDDCDGLTDDGLSFITYYNDNDNDGFGNAGVSVTTCNGAPTGYVTDNSDCNDFDAAIYPGATEVCNGFDDDCDGITDDGTVPPLGGINGPAQQCIPVIAGSATFSVVPVPGITTYTWSLPAGLNIVSGQGTATIQVNWTAAYAHDGIAGVMSVTGSNNCGGGSPVTVNVDMHYTFPVRPASISGPNRLCNGETAIFSVALVARATLYTWSLPAGMSILSGQGSNVITASVGAGFGGGQVEVYCSNVCGAGLSRTKTLALNTLGAPAAISGQSSGLCGMNGVMYSTAPVVGATSYTWAVPGGASIAGGQGTNMITVNFGPGFTGSGFITVAAVNGCGTGASRLLSVNAVPATPGTISGDFTVCPGATLVQYDVSTVPGATSYNWTAPAGATIALGQGTKTVYVNYGPGSASNLTISLTCSNACGTSGSRIQGGIAVNSGHCGPRMGDESRFSDIRLFPNPASERVSLQFDMKAAGDYRVRITDVSGRVLFSELKSAGEGLQSLEISTAALQAGLYLVYLESGDRSESLRLMVE